MSWDLSHWPLKFCWFLILGNNLFFFNFGIPISVGFKNSFEEKFSLWWWLVKRLFSLLVNENLIMIEIVDTLKMRVICYFLLYSVFISLEIQWHLSNVDICGLPADLASNSVLCHLSLLLVFRRCGWPGANIKFPNEVLWLLSWLSAV